MGNPLEYRCSLTKGVVSSVRRVEVGGVPMKVYQTQTPISSGNSGGGLYTLAGSLIGGIAETLYHLAAATNN